MKEDKFAFKRTCFNSRRRIVSFRQSCMTWFEAI